MNALSEQAKGLRPSRYFAAPVLGVCGFSGSGKTTLLEAAIPHLVSQGLAIAVVKHDSHGFAMDQPGKDSDRFFQAGATVVLRGPSEQAQRRGSSASLSLETTLADLSRDHDLILVEGHKDTKLPKLWLRNENGSLPPAEVTEVLWMLPWHAERLKEFLKFLETWLPQSWAERPLYAGLLTDGKNTRMDQPKRSREVEWRTLAEIAETALTGVTRDRCSDPCAHDAGIDFRCVLLGEGSVQSTMLDATRLADVPGLEGPLAGLLAAHRWDPRAAWMIFACDHPLSSFDVRLLVDQRNPGTWAVMLKQADGQPYPTLGIFEPQSLEVLERAVLERGSKNVQIADLCKHPRTVMIPHARRGLVNTNSAAECEVAVAAPNSKSMGCGIGVIDDELRTGIGVDPERDQAIDFRDSGDS